MCGIFGYIGKRNDAKEIVLKGLKTLEYRGYDSWGIAAVNQKNNNPKIELKKKAGKIGDATIKDLPKGGFAFGHTRWATHGGVTDYNAHPHLDCTQKLTIIHNGIIENYDELKREVINDGHKLVSDTDTEVAIHLIEKKYYQLLAQNHENTYLEAVRLTFNRFEGLNAIIVMNADKKEFIAAKTGSPLAVGRGIGENILASDAHAILPYTKNIYFVDDGEIVSITSENISVYDAREGMPKKVKFTKIGWDIKETDKGKYYHYMLKEIFDQPKVIENIIRNNQKQIDLFSKIIKKSFGTYLIGCGTASYACLAGTYIFSKVAKRHINWAAASEFGYTVDFLTSNSCVIALSQSGETIDLIDAVKKAKTKGARIGAFVNVLGSTLYRLSDDKLLLGAGIETAVVSTKAFTAKISYLILLAYSLSNNLIKGKNELEKSLIILKEVLSDAYLVNIQKLVDIISKYKDIYVIGRGSSYPIALETALKIKEATYIHAEGFAGGELKHGVIALVEKGIPCFAFLPNDETYGASLAGVMEMKARGGFIIGVSYKPHEIFDYYLPVEDCGISSIIPSVVVGQLLSYYLALKRGLDPDKPRNLAKSVTVK